MSQDVQFNYEDRGHRGFHQLANGLVLATHSKKETSKKIKTYHPSIENTEINHKIS